MNWGGATFLGEEATEDAGDVTIKSGHGNLKGNTGNGSSRVFSDARQLEQEFGVGWEFMIRKSPDGFGQGVEIASPTIVAETFPVA